MVAKCMVLLAIIGLNLLDSIHHRGLQVAIGAFPTTHVHSLYVAANERSLRSRRSSLALNYMLRISQTPVNSAFLSRFDTANELLYVRSSRSKPALGIRESPSFSACGIHSESHTSHLHFPSSFLASTNPKRTFPIT